MTTAREIMTKDVEYIDSATTVADAARKLASVNTGVLPICDNAKLKGVVTDRDIVVKVLAQGKDPSKTKVVDLIQGEAVTIGADDDVDLAIRTMKDHQVRRLPVIDGTELVGMVSQADIARSLPHDKVGELVDAISSAP